MDIYRSMYPPHTHAPSPLETTRITTSVTWLKKKKSTQRLYMAALLPSSPLPPSDPILPLTQSLGPPQARSSTLACLLSRSPPRAVDVPQLLVHARERRRYNRGSTCEKGGGKTPCHTSGWYSYIHSNGIRVGQIDGVLACCFPFFLWVIESLTMHPV